MSSGDMVFNKMKERHHARQEQSLQIATLEVARERGLKDVILNPDAKVEDKLIALRDIHDRWFVRDRVKWDEEQAVRLAAIDMIGDYSYNPQRSDVSYLREVSGSHADYKTRKAAASQASRIKYMLDVEDESRH